jgi:hypothetical protein
MVLAVVDGRLHVVAEGLPLGGVPGVLCNPTRTFLPPNPNR